MAVETWFASHPLEESRIERSRRLVEAIPPGELEGLVEDDRAYQEFRQRVMSLPAPPARPAAFR